MHYAPRTIAFFCELRHPAQVVDPARIQKVHNAMFESASPEYRSFNVGPDGAVLSNPAARPGMVSSAAFVVEAFQFREELSGLTVEEFAERVRDVTGTVASTAGQQIFTAQIVTVRTLVNPRNYKDSRVFLREGMFGFGDQLEDFRRPSQLFGLRMVFPPAPDEQNAFTLRIESFANDPRSIFIENQGSFGPTVVANGIEPIAENVQSTYDFLVERALPFLAHFDLRQEA